MNWKQRTYSDVLYRDERADLVLRLHDKSHAILILSELVEEHLQINVHFGRVILHVY